MAMSVADNREITPESSGPAKEIKFSVNSEIKISRTSLSMWISILVVKFVWEVHTIEGFSEA